METTKIKKKFNKDEVSKTRLIFANNIVYFRLKRNWSQDELAEALKTNWKYISSLENARRNTKLDFVDRIANVFHVPVSELFVERPKVPSNRKKR